MVALVPTVLLTMSNTAPALGPPMMWTRYPRRSRASVWLVTIVEVVPPVAVSDTAPTVVPVEKAPAQAAEPAAKPPVGKAGDGMLIQPSSDGL